MGLKVQNVVVTTDDGVKLKGWLVRGDNSKRIIVYFHGNMVGKADDIQRSGGESPF